MRVGVFLWNRTSFACALVALLGLAGCGGVPPGGGIGTPPQGLSIVIEGLPAGVDGSVEVHGPSGLYEVVTSSQVLAGLVPGDYEVLAFTVSDGSDGFVPTPNQRAVSISSASGASVTVTYDEVQAVLTADSKPVDAAVASTIVGFTPPGGVTTSASGTQFYDQAGGTLTFGSDSAYLQGLQPGDVMTVPVTSSTPYGVIGRVLSMTPSGSQTIVELAPAALDEALVQGAASYRQELKQSTVTSVQVLAAGVDSMAVDPQQLDRVCVGLRYQFVKDESAGTDVSTGGQFCTEVTLVFSPRKINGEWAVDFSVRMSEEVDLDFEATQTIEFLEKRWELAKYVFTPITVFVGAVPLVFTPELTLAITMEGKVEAGITAGVSHTASLTRGMRYDAGTVSLVAPPIDVENDASPPTASAGVSVEAGAGPEAVLMLYGVAGPAADLKLSLGMDATRSANTEWEIYGGLRLQGKLEFEMLDTTIFEETLELLNLRETLLSGSFNGVKVSISPEVVTLQPGETKAFTAAVTGAIDPGVTWSATCGTFTNTGNPVTYRAPNPSGATCEVTATSVEDATQAATAVVTVTESPPPPTTLWTVQFGTERFDRAHGLAVDGSGNVLIVGETEGSLDGPNAGAGPSPISSDVFVRKYDGAGNVLWADQFGTSQSDEAFGVAVDASGNVVVAGQMADVWDADLGLGREDAFVRKYDAAGNVHWTIPFGTEWFDRAFGVAVDGSGNVLVVGDTTGSLGGPNAGGPDANTPDAFVRKYDGAGNVLWTDQFGTSGSEGFRGVAVDGSGNVLVAGHIYNTPDVYYSFVRKYDASGNVLWTDQFGTAEEDSAYGVAVDGSGSVVVVGRSGIGSFVRKYDGAGNVLWTKRFGATNAITFVETVAVDGLGNVLVAGYTAGSLEGENAGFDDVIVRKYDGTGNVLWTDQFGTSGAESAGGVAVDASGSVFVAGLTSDALEGVNAGLYDAFLRKYAP